MRSRGQIGPDSGTATEIPYTALMALHQAAAPPDTAAVDSVVVESPLPAGAAEVVHFLLTAIPQWAQVTGVFVGAALGIALLVIGWRRRERIRGWFAVRSGAWKLGMTAILLVILGGAGFAGVRSWNFIKHDNSFCSGCHVMAEPFRTFTASEHATLMCHECHEATLLDKTRQLYQWVAERPEKIGPHAPVPTSVCVACHIQRDADSTWKRISATAGHAVHLNPRSPLMRQTSCLTCHGEEVHRFRPAQRTCAQAGCHDRLRIQLGRMAELTSLQCSACHVFAAATIEANPIESARVALQPGQQQCLACHEMRERIRNFRPEQDPHEGRCGDCHDPHAQTTAAGAYQSCGTVQCHARSDTLTAMHRGIGGPHKLEMCGACHVAHTWRAGRTDCRSCHSGISDPEVQVRPPRLRRAGPGQPPPDVAPGSAPEVLTLGRNR